MAEGCRRGAGGGGWGSQRLGWPPRWRWWVAGAVSGWGGCRGGGGGWLGWLPRCRWWVAGADVVPKGHPWFGVAGRAGRVDGVGDRGAGLSATPATAPIGVDGVGDRMRFGSMA